ncbi:type III pantothenate kinase [Robbsia sp. Bb-Pol-6]|uniref:Type III pantothenate kinase n=1 Tax=Robbsia betulipollinis TaxID=2981849 RepID=A0ABT3ZRC2_9BURK|nr:type III pantothenate kinase [Robbsia betulipollinis]MCY0389081.1 type III pantothenate kinase [Robbsia betulipollinis]
MTADTLASPCPLLLIDAGNSRVKWALRDAAGGTTRGGSFDRLPGDTAEANLLAEWARLPRPGAIWISNVAGAASAARLAALLERQWPGVPRTTIAARPAQCGLVNDYVEPAKLGSDRWAGMIGAHALYPGEALLIATLGTATTIDAIDAHGHFVGGLIAPGWTLMMRSLGEHTAQLPSLNRDDARRLLDAPAVPPGVSANASTGASAGTSRVTDGAAVMPRAAGTDAAGAVDTPLFARTTATALLEGCRLAQVGLIESAWRAAHARSGGPVRCIVSGGAAPEVVQALTIPFTRHDHLVLAGLALIAADATAPIA